MNPDVRFYRIAGITIRVESDLPFQETTLSPKFKGFEAEGPGEDTVTIRHRFGLPPLNPSEFGREIYRRPPWAVFERDDSWLYLGITSESNTEGLHKVAVFSKDYSRGVIYHPDENGFRFGGCQSLTFFPTDQIYIAQLLAERNGCYMHSSGVSLDGRGFLFVGHSEAGKSTMVKMIKGRGEILCDDRVIIRKEGGAFRIHGTWSHGEVPDVSPASAPLEAICFLRQSPDDRMTPIRDAKKSVSELLACLIKPCVTAGWWDRMFALVGDIGRNVPCYDLHFNKSGRIIDVLKDSSPFL